MRCVDSTNGESGQRHNLVCLGPDVWWTGLYRVECSCGWVNRWIAFERSMEAYELHLEMMGEVRR
jgi:hypothetical protein